MIIFCLYIIKFDGDGGIGGELDGIFSGCMFNLRCVIVVFCIFRLFRGKIHCILPVLKVNLHRPRDHTNNIRKDFELTSSTLIEVDPYCHSQRAPTQNSGANISDIDFSSGQGSSGVDLRWHHPKEFKALSANKNDKLIQ